VRPDDNSGLYHSLKRSYIRMFEKRHGEDEYNRDVSPAGPDHLEKIKEVYITGKKEFKTIKTFNHMGNVSTAFGAEGIQ
jgi:hypothetical protein